MLAMRPGLAGPFLFFAANPASSRLAVTQAHYH